MKMNDSVKAIESYQKAEKIAPLMQESYQFITEYLLDEKQNYSEALKYADILLEKVQSDDKVLLTYKGRALIGLGRYEEADEVFDHLLLRHPDDSRGYYYKGEINRKQSKMDKAKESFEMAKTLSERRKDQQGAVSALNRLVNIYLTEQNHEKVIEKASELLDIEEDDKIRSYKAQSLIALGRTQEGFKDFRRVFKNDPSDVFNARRLIEAVGLKKGYNEIAKIDPFLTLINDNRFTANILDRFTEQSIFMDFEVIAGTLEANKGNAFIRRSIAHHLMKNAVFLYFNDPSALKKNISDTIGLFVSFGEDLCKELLAEYWGSEKGAYLEFRADKHEGDFISIDSMIDGLDIINLDKATCGKIYDEIQSFQSDVKRPDSVSIWFDVEISNQSLKELFDHIKTTYASFRVNKRAENYWDKVKDYVSKLILNDQDLLIKYTFSQIGNLALQSKKDFEESMAPYHSAKNKLLSVLELDATITEDDQREIKEVQRNNRYFLRTCRSPRYQNTSILEIYEKVSDTSRTFGLPVNFLLEGIDEDDYISVDPVRLQDCIENLIFNAHNAVTKKIGSNKNDIIQVVFSKVDGKFTVSCQDSGKGMSPDEIEKFRNGSSTGLGVLCIIKAVEDHDGELFVESEEGVGTIIKILLKF